MVRDPAQFQVIVTSNMFGDILTDLRRRRCRAGWAWRLRQHPSRPPDACSSRCTVRALKFAGQNVANSMGAILTAGLMLERLGWTAEAQRIEAAVRWAVENDRTTSDIGGTLARARSERPSRSAWRRSPSLRSERVASRVLEVAATRAPHESRGSRSAWSRLARQARVIQNESACTRRSAQRPADAKCRGRLQPPRPAPF